MGDGDLRLGLEQLAHGLGLGDAVLFLGSRKDVPAVLAAADIFVLTSRTEASPVSILEAMAAGKPVVAPRVGSIAESVADGVTGYLTTPGSAEETSRRIVSLMLDPVGAARMGAAGSEAVRRHGSLERMVEGYQDLIAEIYASKCRGGAGGAKRPESALGKPEMLAEGAASLEPT